MLLALSAVETGSLFSRSWLLVVAVCALVAGWQRGQVVVAIPAPGPDLPRTTLATVGIALLAVGVLGNAAIVVSKRTDLSAQPGPAAVTAPVRIALPPTTLGLPRNEELTKTILGDVAAPPERQLAFYGEPSDGVVVSAGPISSQEQATALQDAQAGAEVDLGELGEGLAVPPGDPNGEARCWAAALQGNDLTYCLFVGQGSVVAILDFAAPDLPSAGARGLEVVTTAVSPG